MFRMKSKESPVPTISLMVDAEYRELADRHAALSAELTGLEKDIKSLEKAIKSSNIPAAVISRGVRVAKLLGDPEPEAALDRSALIPLRERAGDLRLALAEIARRQDQARRRASIAVCESIRPHYFDLVRDVATALIAAHSANAKLRHFCDELNNEGVAWTAFLPPCQPFVRIDGDISRFNSIATYLKEVTDAGIIKQNEIPADLGGNPLEAPALDAHRPDPTKIRRK